MSLGARRMPAARDFEISTRVAPLGATPSATTPPRRHGAGYREPFEEEVAIVAQELVNANHPQEQRRVGVAAPDARAAALRAAL